MRATAAYAPVQTVHERDDGESTVSATTYTPIGRLQDYGEGQSFAGNTKQVKKRNNTAALENIEDNWLLEIFCVAIGTMLIVALYFVLQTYDGQIAPKFGSAFGSSLTLNTIVAIIAATAKVLLLLPVAECLGQLRWIWFARESRQLTDFTTFDRAVRGSIWSGFELLWMTKLR
jgi:hypothetical protein